MGNLLDEIKLGKRYVYFMSQSNAHPASTYAKTSKILSELKAGITKSSNKLESKKQETRMDTALNFLKSSAENERNKEVRFFQNFNAQFPEMKQLFEMEFSQESMEKDYINFIANINKTLKGTENFQKQLNNESKRIERYDAAKKYGTKGKPFQGLEKQYYETLTDKGRVANAAQTIFQKDSTKSFESLLNNKTTESEITNYIMSNFGGKIFSLNASGKLNLNSAGFASLVKILNDKAYDMLESYYGKVGSKRTNLNKQLDDELFTKEYTDFVDGLLNAPNLSDALASISEQFGITDKVMEKINVTNSEITALTNKIDLGVKELRGKQRFSTWFEKNKGQLNLEDIVRAIGSISVQGYYTGEDLGLAEILSAGFGGALGGRANATDDINLGKLIITYGFEGNISDMQAKYESELLRLQKQYYDEFVRTTDLDSFEHNTEKIREMRKQQLATLKQLRDELPKGQEGLKYLTEHINIHDTIKGYASGGSTTFQKHGGFEGAAFGSNLNEQLKILSSVEATGGLSEEDINFFKFAMVNAGSNMIGASMKKSLEDYFSVFLGFFMFNDAALMIEEAKQSLEDQMEPQVTELHIYQLNGVYVPSSYLLQQTWEQLAKAAENIQTTALSGQGTRAKLHTYDRGYISGNTPEQMFDIAEKSTKLEMRFLGGFFDLLNSISDSMNNLG